ncbi:hypothetical protein ACWEDZ_02780 [Streptomyces sp. NPDC005047]
MKTTVVSSSELAAKPWGAVHHFPATPSEEAQRLVRAFEFLSAQRNKHPEDADPKNWDETTAILVELAEKRSRQFRTGSVEQRAGVKADTELFQKAGLLPPRQGAAAG